MAKVKQSGSMVMVITVCVLFVVGIITYITAKDVFKEVSVKNNKKYKVLIDSGHGGIDPGKVGVNGAYEKDINLAISLYLKEELQKKDCEVVMTRETDTGLYSEGDRSKKIADLKKRVELMNSEKPDAIVSIHQNSFTQESSKGAQVFYQTTSEEGKKFAEIMQKELDQSKYFYRCPQTEPYHHIIFNHLEHKGTAYTKAGRDKLKNKIGVFIDIFPMYPAAPNAFIDFFHTRICRFWITALWSTVGAGSEKNPIKRFYYKKLALMGTEKCRKNFLNIIQTKCLN